MLLFTAKSELCYEEVIITPTVYFLFGCGGKKTKAKTQREFCFSDEQLLGADKLPDTGGNSHHVSVSSQKTEVHFSPVFYIQFVSQTVYKR